MLAFSRKLSNLTPMKDSNIFSEERKLIEMDDRIDDYILGKMTPEEEQIFLSDCKENPELKHRAYMTALMVKGIRNIAKENNSNK